MPTRRKKIQFDLAELALIALFVGFSVWRVVPVASPGFGDADEAARDEMTRLKASYGPAHYSQFQEEWIIRDFFKDKREGTFVDVGANHYRDGSTTYYLEKQLGWSGIAVDPQTGFEADYRRYRPRTRFFPFFVGDVSNQSAKLYMVNGNSQTVSAFRPRQRFAITTEIEVPTVTLTDLLESTGITRVDLLSIDVELSEPQVLSGFDIEQFKPALVCIEAHSEVRQQILDFFTTHSYVVVGRYLRIDPVNLYFTSLGSAK